MLSANRILHSVARKSVVLQVQPERWSRIRDGLQRDVSHHSPHDPQRVIERTIVVLRLKLIQRLRRRLPLGRPKVLRVSKHLMQPEPLVLVMRTQTCRNHGFGVRTEIPHAVVAADPHLSGLAVAVEVVAAHIKGDI